MGYHAFHMHPHAEIVLKVEVEENNPNDSIAIRVVIYSEMGRQLA